MLARAGQVLDGKYELLGEIGRGGMSTVYLAVDRRSGAQWAVKEICKSGSGAKHALAEASMMARLDHPMIPHVKEILEDDESYYIVMDYLAGYPLGDVLRRCGPLPRDLVLQIGIQLCDVLAYLHTLPQPIIYCDLKPANIMLLHRDPVAIRLFDFGIAQYCQTAIDSPPMGTRGFAAPEQFERGRPLGVEAEIYGLGATLYSLLTGRMPPAGHGIPSGAQRDETPLGKLGDILQKCTQERPKDRYRSCAAVKHDLDLCFRDISVPERLNTGQELSAALDRSLPCEATLDLDDTVDLEAEESRREPSIDEAKRVLRFCTSVNILICGTDERI